MSLFKVIVSRFLTRNHIKQCRIYHTLKNMSVNKHFEYFMEMPFVDLYAFSVWLEKLEQTYYINLIAKECALALTKHNNPNLDLYR